MDAPGGRDKGKQLDPSVAGELEVPRRGRVEDVVKPGSASREPAREDPGNPRPALGGEESADAFKRTTEVRAPEAPDAPGGDEHP